MEFERQEKYIVLKLKDITKYLSDDDRLNLSFLCEKVKAGREIDNKKRLECVCIESDWDCYDDAWKLVEKEFIKDNTAP